MAAEITPGLRAKSDDAKALRRRIAELALPFAGPLIVLFLWFVVSHFELASPLLMPAPAEAFARLGNLLWSGDLFPDFRASLWRWTAGYSVGCIVGVPIGLVLGSSSFIYRASFSLIDFLRSLPVTALFPLFLLLF